MRYANVFGKTQKNIPANVTAVNHVLLLKAGYIRQVSAGRYALMPLGFRVWEKVIKVIDEEISLLGSTRITTPTLHPLSIWQKTNRDKAFGDEMLLVEDHHGGQYAIGATAEGLMTELVKAEKPSYRDLPIVIHQFVQKFRDEKRPRGGLIRLREFMMKDAYSFHSSAEELMVWYENFKAAYEKIATRFDLKVVPVLADSGALGGDYNHEFMVVTDSGEDTIAMCTESGYAANLEAAQSKVDLPEQDKDLAAREEFVHDEVVNCEELAKLMSVEITKVTKTILFKADNTFVAAMIRGDYDINEVKLRKYLGADTLTLATPEEVLKLTGTEVGFVGPIDLPDDLKLVADLTCEGRVNFETGSNRRGIHYYNVNFERDFSTPVFADIRLVKDGDKAIDGQGNLKMVRAIEWGHIFNQAQFYSKPHEALFVDRDGTEKPIWQGAYGIGIERTIACIVETHHDDLGIVWPKSVAPFQLHLLTLGDKPEVHQAAEALYDILIAEKIEVLFDERVLGSGEKLQDADLIGIPLRCVISERSLASGGVEITDRQSKKVEILNPDQVADHIHTFYT